MDQITIQQAIKKVSERKDLTRAEARKIMADMMDNLTTSAQIGSFITALKMKGETVEEITGFAECMRNKANRVQTVQDQLLDTCGTGGDGGLTFNVSTASAIVAAAGGIRVAKHGNRAMSSKPTSGSMDVLERLGININLNHKQASECLDKLGICFMFAQVFHHSMKHVAIPRKEIGIRTIFNMLGPLTNPASADRQLLGVFDLNRTETMAGVLRELGVKRAMVVASEDGLDEISISAPTKVTELHNGEIKTYTITPDDLGLRQVKMEDIGGGDAEINSGIIRMVFEGERGANRDIVLGNAGACFYLAGLCTTLQEGVKIAANTIDDGLAMNKLNELIAFSKQYA